jgi:hypothetical protein
VLHVPHPNYIWWGVQAPEYAVFSSRFRYKHIITNPNNKYAGPRSRAVYGRSLAGIAGPNPVGHEMSLVSAVCCQVEVSATDWSLVHRSPTECGVPECDLETSTWRRPRRTRTAEPWGRVSAYRTYTGLRGSSFVVCTAWQRWLSLQFKICLVFCLCPPPPNSRMNSHWLPG